MKHLKKFNESKPGYVEYRKLDFHDMMEWLERKYNFKHRGFSGIPSTTNPDNHFNDWCNKHGLPMKDSEGKDRESSQEFWIKYREAEDGERAKIPYMDFWHYLCDENDELSNGSFIYIPQEVDTSKDRLHTPEGSIELYQRLLNGGGIDRETERNLKALIKREEERIKNPVEDPYEGWKQQITDLIFKEFGDQAEDGYLKVWVDW